MPIEEIVILANSRKPGGRCVAGISIDSEAWVRPVSGLSSSGALSRRDCAVEGRMVEGLDIVRIGDCSPVEDPAQPENVLIDHSDWELTGALSLQEAYAFLRPHLAPGPELLGGTGKEMADAEAREGVEASLTLVEPDSITFLSQENPFRQGARQARAIFDIASQGYNLSITDRVVAPLVKGMGDGIYAPEELDFQPDSHIVLTVSLAEPLNGVRYKLVAGVHILP